MVTKQSAARYSLGKSWCGTLPRNTTFNFRFFASSSKAALDGPSPAMTRTASTVPVPDPPSLGFSAGKMRSVPFSPERRWTIKMTFVLSSWTPKRLLRTSWRSFELSIFGVNTSCVPDGTLRKFSSCSLPKWSLANTKVGAAFKVPHLIAGHFPIMLYVNMPNLTTGAKGTCSCANMFISTWWEQYTGMRLHEQVVRTKLPIKEGKNTCTTSQLCAPRNHANFTPGL
mmetsp:Transcript_19490/g.54432  ORF Transcript_19490/g.54432 Transcript_19490/m.54432 type:complete len:227 (-) Transcript_19490:508-1188(-)